MYLRSYSVDAVFKQRDKQTNKQKTAFYDLSCPPLPISVKTNLDKYACSYTLPFCDTVMMTRGEIHITLHRIASHIYLDSLSPSFLKLWYVQISIEHIRKTVTKRVVFY